MKGRAAAVLILRCVMALARHGGTRDFGAFADIGGRPEHSARRTLPVLGGNFGAPVEGEALIGAAGAAVSISHLRGREVVISANGACALRFDANPTATAFHLTVTAGHPIVVRIPEGHTDVRGWGLGETRRYCITPIDGA